MKDYIKRGLVDILDREGNRRGCSACSDEFEAEPLDIHHHSLLKNGQRPSDM